jgi:hypothetical protein
MIETCWSECHCFSVHFYSLFLFVPTNAPNVILKRYISWNKYKHQSFLTNKCTLWYLSKCTVLQQRKYKHVGVVLSVLMYEIWINVLLYTSALVGPLHIVNWNARRNSEILNLGLHFTAGARLFGLIQEITSQQCCSGVVTSFADRPVMSAVQFLCTSTVYTLNYRHVVRFIAFRFLCSPLNSL